MAGLFSPDVFPPSTSSFSSSDVLFPKLKRDSLFNSLSKMMDIYEPTMQSQGHDALKEEHQHSTFTTQHHQQSFEMIPFDSPLDQSLGSPESTRDYSSSPFQNYEFDFSGVEDAIMFPNHGTQEMHGDAYFAEFPLFGHLSKQEPNVSFPSASQQIMAEAVVNSANPCDFSFDAMTTTTQVVNEGVVTSSPAPSSSGSSQGYEGTGINQLAVVFVREYARTHPLNDIDVLLRALRVAGIEVSDHVVAEILASTSVASYNSPSPSPLSATSPMSFRSTQSMSTQSMENGSVSPMSLPVSATTRSPLVAATTTITTAPLGKTRSSIQSSAKDHLVIDTRHGKRFVCSICNKQFDRAFNLRTHAMTHIDPEDRDKPFMCPWGECSKSFSRKYDAERHYRSVHLKKGEVATKQQVQVALSGRHYHDDEDDSPSNG